MVAIKAQKVLVTGASRGLGLGFVERWLADGREVFGLARNAKGSQALSELAQRYPGALHLCDCDVADDASVKAAAETVSGLTKTLDLVVNNAGVFGPHGDSLASLDHDEIRRVFEINTLGPLRVARAFLPLLERGREPRLVSITSLMGSIGDNASGGSWAYRISKAALNMAHRNLAHECSPRGVVVALLHPGWVKTDMGGAGAPLSVEESVSGMIRVMDGITVADAGAFFDWEGDPQPW